MRVLLFARVALLLLCGVGTAHADLRDARSRFLRGDYAGAQAAAKKEKGEDADCLRAEIERENGRLAEARALLEPLVKKHPRHLRARVQLGLVYRELGERKLAEASFSAFFDDWDQGSIDRNAADQLMYVAIAARYLGSFKDANETFRDAVDADPNLIEANLEWGNLFLEKYAAGEAEVSFDDALKVNPNHPDAHVGMARVNLEQNYDFRAALDHINKALAENPRHKGALKVRAEMEVDNEEFATARKTLAQVLRDNPNDLETHSMLGAICFLVDDQACFAAEKQKVFGLNATYSRFYDIVAEFAGKQHRYSEAIPLEEAALALDPKDPYALAAIGTNYLRMGEEKKGLEALGRAFDRDSFNVRVFNMLNLFDDVIAREYDFVTSEHLKLRVKKTERKMLERIVPKTLERAFSDMVARYGFTPKTPVTVELYDDPADYSRRTIGLPNLGALGVCFGQVITALSPANGNINWGMVLWHELGHVFALQLSRSRVPRWFTEGLSEYETLIARKEWRRENDADVWMALETGELPSVAELNTMFLRSGSMEKMVVAYHTASLTVEFLATRWGFPKVVLGLKLFGQGKDTTAVIRAITGLDVVDFDREFRKHLEARFQPYRGTFRVRQSDYADATELEKTAAAKPKDPDAQAALAIAYLLDNQVDEASAAIERALALDAKCKKAWFARAKLEEHKHNPTGAKQGYETLISVGGDGYDARLGLAQLALEAKNDVDAEKQLALAKKLDPESSEPPSLLSELYFRTHREDAGLAELERYVMLEQMEYGPVKKLVDKYATKKNWAKVREFGEMALYINPLDAGLYQTMGQAAGELGVPDDAISEYESALLCEPPLRRPAIAHIGLARAYLGKKDLSRASQAIAKALESEPANAEALELKGKIE